jgi:hypothetical protein
MGAVEDTRKVIQDFLAPELRSLSAKMESLVSEQARLYAEQLQLRTDLRDSEGRTRAEIAASEARITAAIDRLRSEMTLVARTAVLEQALAEKQRVIDEFQKQPH